MNLRPSGYEPDELTSLLHPASIGFMIVAHFSGFGYGTGPPVVGYRPAAKLSASSKVAS